MQISEISGLRTIWAETLGEPSVCVAVLDGSVDLEHPCFAGASIEPLETLVCNMSDSGPASQHGTHVANITSWMEIRNSISLAQTVQEDSLIGAYSHPRLAFSRFTRL